MKRLSLLLMAIAWACGGGGGNRLGPGAISESQAEPICRDYCEFEVACGREIGVEECVDDCVGDVAGWARGDAVQTFFECAVSVGCTGNDDACLDDIQPLAVHQQWETACRAQLGVAAQCLSREEEDVICEVSPNPADDDIGFVRLIAPPIVEEMIACLNGADCEARINCLIATFERYNIDF
jgi:hypothetical protein